MPAKLLALLPLIDNEIILPAVISAMKGKPQMNGLGSLSADDVTASVNTLKSQASMWEALYRDFLAAQPASNDPNYPRWKSIFDSASSAKLKIQQAFDAVGSVGSWLSNLFRTSSDATMMGLGVVPIIVVGAALTAIGVTAYSMRQYLTDVSRMNITAQLVRDGKAPASLLAAPTGGLFSNLEGMTKWIVIGGVAFVVWQFLKKRGSL